jgi:hypothetical protein
MEEAVPQKAESNAEPENIVHRKRRKAKNHPLHLHHAQRRLLGRAAIFAAFVLMMLMVWYWMAVRR